MSILPSLLASTPPPSITSEIPSPSASKSYGFDPRVPSVSGGVKPPDAEEGTPLESEAPSAFPSKSASTPPPSSTSEMPSPSESKSKRFGMPSPSVSQVVTAGEQAAFSTLSKIPSLSLSKSALSEIPSPSVSGLRPKIVKVLNALEQSGPFARTVMFPLAEVDEGVAVMEVPVEVPVQPFGRVHV